MSIQNVILSDIVIASGGSVTNEHNRNQLLQDWLSAASTLGLELVTNGFYTHTCVNFD